MNKGKARPNIDFEILHIGVCQAVICTRLPIEEATNRLNAESPTGISSKWALGRGLTSCPDGQGKTHYPFFC